MTPASGKTAVQWASRFTPQAIDKIIATFEKSVPKAGRSASTADNTAFTHLVANVRMLLENPSHQSDLSSSLTKSVKDIKQQGGDDSWGGRKAPEYVGSMDTNWQAQWLVRVSEKAANALESFHMAPLTRTQLDEWSLADPKIVPSLFQLFCAVCAYTALPAQCQYSRVVAAMAFELRCMQVDLISNWLIEAQTINWCLQPGRTDGGAYKFDWDDEGKLTKVWFLNGTSADPPVFVDRTFELKDRFSIHGATFVKGIAKYQLKDFWKAHEGPNEILIGPGKRDPRLVQLQGIVDRVHSDRAAAEQEVAQFNFGTAPYLGEARKRKNAEHLQKAAKAALVNSKRRRYVSLAGASPKADKKVTSPVKKKSPGKAKKPSPVKAQSPRVKHSPDGPKLKKSKIAEEIEKAIAHGLDDLTIAICA